MGVQISSYSTNSQLSYAEDLELKVENLESTVVTLNHTVQSLNEKIQNLENSISKLLSLQKTPSAELETRTTPGSEELKNNKAEKNKRKKGKKNMKRIPPTHFISIPV